MIDFLKIHNLSTDTVYLKNNGLLTFPLSNVGHTGETLNRAQIAHFRGLQFIIRGSNCGLKGSLHKYWFNGENWPDYHLSDIRATILELSETFSFDPETSPINFLEIGVNIPLESDPTRLIKCFVLYRNTSFERLRVTGKGFGKIAETQQFAIKVYNKSMQYGLSFHLLRFEIKILKTEFLKRYGIDKLSLADLCNPKIYDTFLTILLDVLTGILVYDPNIKPDKITDLQGRELFSLGRFAEFWQTIDRRRKHEKMNRFAEIAGTNRIKSMLEERIVRKWKSLNDPDKLTSFHKEQNKSLDGQINPTIKSYSVRTCQTTNLVLPDIQKPHSKYLSSKGVQWYFENNHDIYQNILFPVLTEKWLRKNELSPIEKFFDEIAHQLRNRDRNPHNNPRNNTKTSYRRIENKGYKLFPTRELIRPDKLALIGN